MPLPPISSFPSPSPLLSDDFHASALASLALPPPPDFFDAFELLLEPDFPLFPLFPDEEDEELEEEEDLLFLLLFLLFLLLDPDLDDRDRRLDPLRDRDRLRGVV
eukprot:Hpha_TRINITY_DN15765_c1_g9::TRINITY_DN15765_c1_g9_i1::g.39578::m.39578